MCGGGGEEMKGGGILAIVQIFWGRGENRKVVGVKRKTTHMLRNYFLFMLVWLDQKLNLVSLKC